MVETIPKGKRFPKRERLRHKKAIGHLFGSGASFYVRPFRVLYRMGPDDVVKQDGALPQVLFAVPKKKFPKAVDRNRIRRKVREAYRLDRKSYLLNQKPDSDKRFIRDLCIIYTSNQDLPFVDMRQAMRKVLEKLQAILEE